LTKLSILLATLATSASLIAQGQPEKSKYWPFEIQLGASFMGYNSHDSSGPNGTASFSPKNPRLAPSVRFSIDPIRLPFGSILFSAGYRTQNDVPLNHWSDLSHKEQTQFGALLRFETSSNFEFGVGADTRRDWMKVPRLRGTETQDTAWRPWVRANARYMFDKGTNATPFVGLEAAFALSSPAVNNYNHYRDYAINSGLFELGNLVYEDGTPDRTKSTESFTKGHFPAWEVAVVGGIRFGRHGIGTPKPAKVTPSSPATPSIAVEAQPQRPVQPVDDSARIRAEEEARRKAAEDARLAEDARRRAEEEARRRVETQVVDVDGLRIHFRTDGFGTTAADRALVKSWAEKYKGIDASGILIVGHCDIRGLPEHNQQLSMQRARALAGLLRAEGINIPAGNIIGRSFSQPLAGNETPEGLARDRRAEVSVGSTRYRVIPTPSMEGRLIVER